MELTDLTCHMDALYGYAMVLARDSTSAADLVQETYLRALKAKSRLYENSNIKSWMFTILRNIWLNQLRARKVSPKVLDLDAEGGEQIGVDRSMDPHDQYVSRLDVERVRAAIQQLPLGFREIILLREYEELSYQEIAVLLSCPLGTVMSRLARARSRLRQLLREQPRTAATKGEEPCCYAADD